MQSFLVEHSSYIKPDCKAPKTPLGWTYLTILFAFNSIIRQLKSVFFLNLLYEAIKETLQEKEA